LLQQAGGGARLQRPLGLEQLLQAAALDQRHAVEGLAVHLAHFVTGTMPGG